MARIGNGMSRRSFFKQATGLTAAVGFPTIIPATTLGSKAQGIPPASEQIRIGCIGLRNQGTGNLKALVKNVVALCDVDRNVLAAAQALVQKQTGRTCAAYGDYRRLLESKDVDAVVVTTPDHWHALITIHACEAGKDVYCEKPLTLTIAEGRAIVRAARQHNRIVQTGSQQRSDEKFRRACELVRGGRIGKVHTVRVGISGVNFNEKPVPDGPPPAELDYDFWLGPAPQRPYNKNRVHYNFRFFWDYSGGQMTNWGAHHLDIAQWGLGMDDSGPVEVVCQKVKYHPQGWVEVPVACRLEYTYANGVKLLLGQGEEDIRGGTTFEGDRGTIFVNRGKLESKPEEIITTPMSDSDVRLYYSTSHHGNWLSCIRSRKMPICDVEIGHRSATVCHLGNIATRTSKKIVWDPVKEEIVGDAELAKWVGKPYRAPWVLPTA